MALALQQKRPFRGGEAVAERPDGTRVTCVAYATPLIDASGALVGAVNMLVDITERKQAAARQDLLIRETSHRTKNLFAVLSSVISRSFANKDSIEEVKTAVINRVHSLSQTHALLIDREWQGVDIVDIVRAEMSPFAGRATIEGPSIVLNAQAAQNFTLAVHELATNAAKYGALSNQAGRILISWSVHKPNGQRRFQFRWEECGGPLVVAPMRKGFGSTVLEQVMSGHFGMSPKTSFVPTGLVYELSGPLDDIAMPEPELVAADKVERT